MAFKQKFTDKGNTTTYEWTYGEAPLTIVVPPLNFKFDDEDQSRKIPDDIVSLP